MPTFVKEPLRKHRCPRCNADLAYEHTPDHSEERWLCENPICRTVWAYRRPIKVARSAECRRNLF